MERKKLGLIDLLSMSAGQIIGSGIFTTMPIVLGLAGRGVCWGMVIGCLICILTCIPKACIASLMELPGGSYSQAQLVLSPQLAGIYGLMQAATMLLYGTTCISMALYTVQLLPGAAAAERLIALGYLTLFYLLGIFGPALMSKLQNLMLVALLAAIGVFIFGGLPNIQPGYFQTEGMFPSGAAGFIAAISLLTMSFGGGEHVASLSSEAKNPRRDIPIAIIGAPLGVAVIYFFLSMVAAGILPVDQVAAAGNLGIVAQTFLSQPLYLFFMVGGALFALGTTVNSGLAFFKYPWLKMAEDGWLPKALTKKTKRLEYPWVLMLGGYFVGGFIPIMFNVDIASIISFFTIPWYILTILLIFQVRKIPKLYPNCWASSPFHMSAGLLNFFAIAGTLAQIFMVYSLISLSGTRTTLLSIGVGVALSVVLLVRYSMGKVNVEYATKAIRDTEASLQK